MKLDELTIEKIHGEYRNGELASFVEKENKIIDNMIESLNDLANNLTEVKEKLEKPKFKVHYGVIGKNGYFESEKIIEAENENSARFLIEQELDKFETNYNYSINLI